MKRGRLLILLAWIAPAAALRADFDHGVWDSLLGRHVVEVDGGSATRVDYGGMAADRNQLARYLAATAAVRPESFATWSEREQLAFLINVYNARTVELILTAWPEIGSIRELGGLLRSPWEREFFRLLGERRSLDELEHGLIRSRYAEPRIHFAVNCASVGCPALRGEAYTGARLEAQLEQATRDFLSDRSRNRLEAGVLHVSSIFEWYREDFTRGFRGAGSLGAFLALYADALGLDESVAQQLHDGKIEFVFLDYDWTLNGIRD